MTGVRASGIVTRRRVLALLGLSGASALLAACSQTAPASPTAAPAKPTAGTTAPPAASPVAAASPAASPGAAASPVAQASSAAGISSAQWDALVAAARQEGTVAVATYAGSGFRNVMDAFEAAYPGIKVEHTQFQSGSRDYHPRLTQERRAGLFNWDLAFMPNVEMLQQQLPAGALEPIRPMIVRGDVLDDKAWVDGFEAGFIDDDSKWSYALSRDRSESVWVDTSVVADGEIKSVKDLLNPKWKGKLLAGDPRSKGSGYWAFTTMRIKTGTDEVMRQIFQEQDVTVGTDARQLTEFVVRARFPVSIGAVSRPIFEDFRAQGLGTTVKKVDVPEFEYVASGSNLAWYLNKAPHPRAAQVFLNWVLGKDAGMIWSKEIQTNSRRVDVPVADENTILRPGVQYVRMDDQKVLDEIGNTQKIAKDLLN